MKPPAPTTLASLEEKLANAEAALPAIEAVVAAAQEDAERAAHVADRVALELEAAAERLGSAENAYAAAPSEENARAVRELADTHRLTSLRLTKARADASSSSRSLATARDALERAQAEAKALRHAIAVSPELLFSKLSPMCARILRAVVDLVQARDEIRAALDAVRVEGGQLDGSHHGLLPLLFMLLDERGIALSDYESLSVRALVEQGLPVGPLADAIARAIDRTANTIGRPSPEKYRLRLERQRLYERAGPVLQLEEEDARRSQRELEEALAPGAVGRVRNAIAEAVAPFAPGVRAALDRAFPSSAGER